MPKNAQHKIKDLLKYAAQIDHNNAMIDHMASQRLHNTIVYIFGSVILGYIIYQWCQKCSKCNDGNSNNTRGQAIVIRTEQEHWNQMKQSDILDCSKEIKICSNK